MSIEEATAHINGTVALRAPGVVPSGAVLTVTLEDVSKMDAMSETLGVHVIDDLEKLPASFSIRFDPTLVFDEHTYGVRARVEVEGVLMYTTDRNHPVLTRGAPNTVDLSLAAVPNGGRR